MARVANLPCTLQAFAAAPDGSLLTAGKAIAFPFPQQAQTLQLHSISLPPQTAIRHLFGMQLVDITPALQAELCLWEARGVLVLRTGSAAAHLFSVGSIQSGDVFWMVGDTRVANIDEFARQLISICDDEKRWGQSAFAVRTVRDLSPLLQPSGSDTELMQLTQADLAELQRFLHP